MSESARYVFEGERVTYFMASVEQAVSELGGKVASARAERGWSLQQLADRSGLSPAAIHKIEKSGMTPTITSLMKVAAALGKSVSYFIDESEPLRPVTHIRAAERQLLYTSKKGLTLENISGRYGPFFVAGAEALVEPHADSGPEPMVHPRDGRRPAFPYHPEALVVESLEGSGAGDLAGDPELVTGVPGCASSSRSAAMRSSERASAAAGASSGATR
jgi:transcriptional regulator with XRE-family HTH domain